jgi:hypothetical protein
MLIYGLILILKFVCNHLKKIIIFTPFYYFILKIIIEINLTFLEQKSQMGNMA